MKIQVEYVWTDAVDTFRSITGVYEIAPEDFAPGNPIACVPEGSSDGSSTGQAKSKPSDIILIPVLVIEDPIREQIPGIVNLIALCEVLDINRDPVESNARARLAVLQEKYLEEDIWVAFEQEYTLMKEGLFYGWPENGSDLPPQFEYYCNKWANPGFAIGERTKNIALRNGFKIAGMNAEVMPAQWELKVGPLSPLAAADQLLMLRWILQEVAWDEDRVTVTLDPKPKAGDWNGAGTHINFSTAAMREGSEGVFIRACERLKARHMDHMRVYGAGNERRLTGEHETHAYETFDYGYCDREASVRIPFGWTRLEDRRPASNVNPYLALTALLETILGDGFIAPENL